ncbi:MAG: ABC transporter permease [Ilumatobacteraceae bacterium]
MAETLTAKASPATSTEGPQDAADRAPAPGRSTPKFAHFPWSLLGRRAVSGVIVLFVVSLVVFGATQALPSDPAHAILGRNATPEQVERVNEALGLDRPVVSQYLGWLSNMVRGDLGNSLLGRTDFGGGSSDDGRSVWSLLGPRLVSSLMLLAVVAAIAIPISLILGSMAAVRRDNLLDASLNGMSIGLGAVPEFVIGMLLTIIFATNVLAWLPAVVTFQAGEAPFEHLSELILPVATLVLATVPYLFRIFRASMIDALESEYVAMARLKGVPERRVVRRHALPNALLPLIQASGLILIYLLGGAVVVESIFNYPGMGTLLIDSVGSRDIPTIQGTTMVIACGVVVFNISCDVLSVVATPRLRTGGRA